MKGLENPLQIKSSKSQTTSIGSGHGDVEAASFELLPTMKDHTPYSDMDMEEVVLDYKQAGSHFAPVTRINVTTGPRRRAVCDR